MVTQYFDIIVLLVIVVVIYSRLRNIIGTHPEDAINTKITEENAAKIFDMILKEADKKQNQNTETSIPQTELSETDKTLNNIPNFNKETFIKGAKKAFEIILSAFNAGDTKTLEMLVNHNLFKKFQDVIEKRRAEGITSETDFIGFDKAEIVNAKITKDNIVKITVEFISQQVNMLKNAQGKVIEGDECYIQNITDVWTFERASSSANPNWLLVSTKK